MDDTSKALAMAVIWMTANIVQEKKKQEEEDYYENIH